MGLPIVGPPAPPDPKAERANAIWTLGAPDNNTADPRTTTNNGVGKEIGNKEDRAAEGEVAKMATPLEVAKMAGTVALVAGGLPP